MANNSPMVVFKNGKKVEPVAQESVNSTELSNNTPNPNTKTTLNTGTNSQPAPANTPAEKVNILFDKLPEGEIPAVLYKNKPVKEKKAKFDMLDPINSGREVAKQEIQKVIDDAVNAVGISMKSTVTVDSNLPLDIIGSMKVIESEVDNKLLDSVTGTYKTISSEMGPIFIALFIISLMLNAGFLYFKKTTAQQIAKNIALTVGALAFIYNWEYYYQFVGKLVLVDLFDFCTNLFSYNFVNGVKIPEIERFFLNVYSQINKNLMGAEGLGAIFMTSILTLASYIVGDILVCLYYLIHIGAKVSLAFLVAIAPIAVMSLVTTHFYNIWKNWQMLILSILAYIFTIGMMLNFFMVIFNHVLDSPMMKSYSPMTISTIHLIIMLMAILMIWKSKELSSSLISGATAGAEMATNALASFVGSSAGMAARSAGFGIVGKLIKGSGDEMSEGMKDISKSLGSLNSNMSEMKDMMKDMQKK